MKKVNNNKKHEPSKLFLLYLYIKELSRKTAVFTNFNVKGKILTTTGFKQISYKTTFSDSTVQQYYGKAAHYVYENTILSEDFSKKVVETVSPVFLYDGVLGLAEDIYQLSTISLKSYFKEEEYPFSAQTLENHLYNRPLYRDFIYEIEDNPETFSIDKNIEDKKKTQAAQKKLEKRFSLYRRKTFFRGMRSRLSTLLVSLLRLIGKELLAAPATTVLVFSLTAISYMCIVVHFFRHERFLPSHKKEVGKEDRLTDMLKKAEKHTRSKRQSLILCAKSKDALEKDEQLLRSLQQLIRFSELGNAGDKKRYLETLRARPDALVLKVFKVYLDAPEQEKEEIFRRLGEINVKEYILRAIAAIEKKDAPLNLILEQIRESFWAILDIKLNVGMVILASILHAVLVFAAVPYFTICLFMLCALLNEPVAKRIDKKVMDGLTGLYTKFKTLREFVSSLDWMLGVTPNNAFDTSGKSREVQAYLELAVASGTTVFFAEELTADIVSGTVLQGLTQKV